MSYAVADPQVAGYRRSTTLLSSASLFQPYPMLWLALTTWDFITPYVRLALIAPLEVITVTEAEQTSI